MNYYYLQLGTMNLIILKIFSVFTLLTGVRRFTHAVPAPYNVSVSCNSYGVMVDWKADRSTGQAEFLLQLKPDNGETVSVRTKHLQYNITNLLQDPTYNRYLAKVVTISGDGKNVSEFAKSQIFSLNFRKTASIICGLDFPKADLIYQDGTLLVNFINPLHLYRHTPVLRNHSSSDKLLYILKTSQTSEVCLKCPLECPLECFHECFLEEKVCRSSVSFPEEQKEYCFTLLGRIRQTLVWETKPLCYRKPGPPVTKYLIMALGSFAALLTVVLVIVLSMRNISQKMRENTLKIWPTSLMFEKPPTKDLEKPREQVATNIIVHPHYICLLDNTEEMKNLRTTSYEHLDDYSEDTDKATSSGSSDEDTDSDHCNEYESEDMNYDMKHVEMSLQDIVNTYGRR